MRDLEASLFWIYDKQTKEHWATGKYWKYKIHKCNATREYKLSYGKHYSWELFTRRLKTLKKIAELLEEDC